MDNTMKEFVETLNKEIAIKAKTIAICVWQDNTEEMVAYIKDKLHEIDSLLDIRTKLMNNEN